MSWSFTVTGQNKREVLAAFESTVDSDANCMPKQPLKYVASSLAAHMGEEHVQSIRCYGHTNENGENCSCAVLINM